jgi:hypothetical protein
MSLITKILCDNQIDFEQCRSRKSIEIMWLGESTMHYTKMDVENTIFSRNQNLIECYMIIGLNILWFGLKYVW